jgi:hypothetical protein
MLGIGDFLRRKISLLCFALLSWRVFLCPQIIPFHFLKTSKVAFPKAASSHTDSLVFGRGGSSCGRIVRLGPKKRTKNANFQPTTALGIHPRDPPAPPKMISKVRASQFESSKSKSLVSQFLAKQINSFSESGLFFFSNPNPI